MPAAAAAWKFSAEVLALQVDLGSAVEWGDLNSLSKKAILAR